MYKLEQYDDTNFRLICTKDNNNFFKYNNSEDKYIDEDEVERISLSRTKRKIRQYARCNHFTYFVTLTLNSDNCDRFSLTECQQLLRKTLKFYKRKNHDFAYIFITEKHENGAFHFHRFYERYQRRR